jgi:hypothetical protein
MRLSVEEFESVKADFDLMGLDKDTKKITDKLFKVWGEQRKAFLMSEPQKVSAIVFNKMVDDVANQVGQPGGFTRDEAVRELERLAARYISDGVAWDFNGIAPENLYNSLKELRSLSDEYPDVMQKLQYVGGYKGGNLPAVIKEYAKKGWTTFDGSTWAHANLTTGEYMGFNTDYYGSRAFASRIRTAEGSGWHPIGIDTTGSVAVHEFGHLVQGSMINKYGTVAEDWERYFANTLSKNRPLRQEEDPYFLSMYAYKKPVYEPWAEGFAQLRLGDKRDLSVFAQELGRFLKFEKGASNSEMQGLKVALYSATKSLGNNPTQSQLLDALRVAGEKHGGSAAKAVLRYLSIRY